VKTTPIRLVAFANCVISFHNSNLMAIKQVRKRADKLYKNRIENTAWVIHGVLDCITDSLMSVGNKQTSPYIYIIYMYTHTYIHTCITSHTFI
jgi:Mg2+ and Co2+ transporter CorA